MLRGEQYQHRRVPKLTWLRIYSLMQPATSLGGVGSTIEYRKGSVPDVHPRVVKLSIGVEELEVCAGLPAPDLVR